MIDSLRILAIIPARGGSKGVPQKNLKLLGGKPLIHWTIEAAQGSQYVDKHLVTSDDVRIIEISREAGAAILERPHHLATDVALSSEVIVHSVEKVPDYDVIIYLQPTSPFRTSIDIDRALEILVNRRESTGFGVVSVVATDIIPEHMYREGKDGLLIKLLPSTERRRQDIPVTYLLNGAIFCAFTNELLAVDGEFRRLSLKPFIMDKIDSLDIDDFSDFETAELVALNRRNGAE